MTQNYNPPTVKCYHCGEWTPIEIEAEDETADIIGCAVAICIKAGDSRLDRFASLIARLATDGDSEDALTMAREIIAEQN